MKIVYDTYDSPLGTIYIVVDEIGVRRIILFENEWLEYRNKYNNIKQDRRLCNNVIRELDEYFNKERKEFQVSLSIEGTEFRKKVWEALRNIPYGEVRSYSQIAEAIGNPKAVRAVGQANRANLLPIIIPCHRVVGKSGELMGYAGNKTSVKQFLLELEGVEI
ncbi:MAG: methylated-DNA--[protein]-cysteine S-methyltransferase [Clostridiaceae bacterium]|uniref:Methylated-DNA--protein-cysteine methyltransferase n=1 Tax=Anaerosalibacter bizertensis TaxID=932217 RepID=A0A844FEA4_9FIRM|nr:methylated-DNA--[protein]-cysteine S-methyltransferase [Anaerosalibacter bizertensis]MBW4827073.1 methylated-DNA--[protein]-cysteine S-methyltransferase [Clostridiaceae bacterium]MBW4858883.1 methylated-DNA--[protein]-cysteine S-methyltransferase [Clostridiaceae bacterium]MBW4869458.1 methylated-DNA--[protein]-cysteine S-methyltransferase [Clostridiaceae bacterium]MSS42323.1 methylated-DNA--[protein]-cysteine S-methyltransferase [Anaerosalibacter bizertensis]